MDHRTHRDADFLRAMPDPEPDYVAAHLELAQTRHTADSHRPENDTRRTQEITAITLD